MTNSIKYQIPRPTGDNLAILLAGTAMLAYHPTKLPVGLTPEYKLFRYPASKWTNLDDKPNYDIYCIQWSYLQGTETEYFRILHSVDIHYPIATRLTDLDECSLPSGIVLIDQTTSSATRFEMAAPAPEPELLVFYQL